jgi:hypothetical protein
MLGDKLDDIILHPDLYHTLRSFQRLIEKYNHSNNDFYLENVINFHPKLWLPRKLALVPSID